MDTASPRDIARLLQPSGRVEKTVLGEHIPRVHGELCGRAFHEIASDWSGPTLETAGAARAR